MSDGGILASAVLLSLPLILLSYCLVSYATYRLIKNKNVILKSAILLAAYCLMALAAINLCLLAVNLMFPYGLDLPIPFTPWTTCRTLEQSNPDILCKLAKQLQFALVGVSLLGTGIILAFKKIAERQK